MTEKPERPSVENIFNSNLDALLEARGLEHRDLLDLLEAASYTPETPATVLLNDAIAISAVLGVSPFQLLVPLDEQNVDVTPSLPADRRSFGSWLRGIAPLRKEDYAVFYRTVALADLDADQVAEVWVWSERLRTAGLAMALNDAVEDEDVERVKMLSELASRLLNQQALERADERVPRPVTSSELQTAITRATRFRRQRPSRKVDENTEPPAAKP